ncbi:beta-1,3-galactosyltransferase brn [Condylostylus longicornis]|uniref:beta-1,3-galactosyltransferase brn n=1 Tax=Condylostylus longicornis TaxID=2530218 RepID=UPI00244DDD2E|nr:beta-1,3-galactosyltransferase brn [Condylostylus longicornis]
MFRTWRSCFYRFKIKYFLFGIICVFLIDFFGIFTHLFELNFETSFSYPLDGDVLRYAHQIRYNQERDVEPINFYNYTFLKKCENKCLEDGHTVAPKVTFIVKSSMKNFNQRLAIRKTWGYERRFSDIVIKTVFVLGINDNRELQKHIDIESEQYQDIVQADFIDTYFNNTIKTMMGFQWAVKYCLRSEFFMFVDDDYYVSTKNVLRFIRYPTKYPEYLEAADEALRKLARRLKQSDLKNETLKSELYKEANKLLAQGMNSVDNKKHYHKIEEFVIKGKIEENSKEKVRRKRNLMDMELPKNAKLFSGFVFSSSPHRHKSSKWYVSLEEYPYHLWPPYVTAGAFILSREALLEMFFVSMFTKHFRFDDIYLGIVAYKAKIQPLHNEEFYFYKATYRGPPSYRYVIASHGYTDPEELNQVWSEVRAAGYA